MFFRPKPLGYVSVLLSECWYSPRYHTCLHRFSSIYLWSYINLQPSSLFGQWFHSPLLFSCSTPHQATSNINQDRSVFIVSLDPDLGRISTHHAFQSFPVCSTQRFLLLSPVHFDMTTFHSMESPALLGMSLVFTLSVNTRLSCCTQNVQSKVRFPHSGVTHKKRLVCTLHASKVAEFTDPPETRQTLN